jgi:hypothetical protein
VSAVVISGGHVLGSGSHLLGVPAAGGGGATLVFTFPSGFTSAPIHFAFEADLSGSALNVTDNTSEHGAGGAWYETQQNITSFTTQFTFQLSAQTTIPTTLGIAFVIQNSNTTTNPGGNAGLNCAVDANCCGYGAFQPPINPANSVPGNSIAVKFDMNRDQGQDTAWPAGGSPNSTGLYANGGPFGGLIPANDMNPYGIDLYAGHVMSCTIVYDGSLLTMVLLDTTTSAQARYVWPVNIPTCVASSTAWLGFTGGTIPVGPNLIQTWTYWTGFNTRLATPTFSVTPGQYSSTQSVTVSGPSGANLFYTTNGLLPTSASTAVTGAISVSANTNLQVVAIKSGFTDSLVAQGSYLIGTSNTINFPSGFSANDGMIICGYAQLSGSSIQLGDTLVVDPEVSDVWYGAPVNAAAAWTCNFAFHITNVNGSAEGCGLTFILVGTVPPATSAQNWAACNASPTLLAGPFGALGYGGLGGGSGGFENSLAIKFDVSAGSTTGLYTNGATPGGGGTSTSPVNISSGNRIACALSYDGSSTISMTLTDSVAGHTFSTTFAVNIASTIGASTGYVGIGATSTFDFTWANLFLDSFTGF